MDKKDEIELWNKFLSCKRINDIKKNKIRNEFSNDEDPRNPFQRDCDRITYSYPFRRLQDKTQVIPLPVIDFVHTRLTHTLEVATVGRSLGTLLENYLVKERKTIESVNLGSIPAVVSAACLAHDIGNPPFGHSGEDSISEFFKFGSAKDDLERNYRRLKNTGVEKKYEIINSENESKITDLQRFEGNAMGFRLLTKYDDEGLNLTCATLAVFTKYPRQSFISGEEILNENGEEVRWNKGISQKKYGFFQTELEEFKLVAKEVGLKPLKIDEETKDYAWARHPLSFLMEAADDICYNVVDLEDGFRIGRISFKEAEDVLSIIAKTDSTFDERLYISINNEKRKFSYLRAKTINVLTRKSFEVFKNNYDEIIKFEFDKDLIKNIDNKEIVDAIIKLKLLVKEKIFQWQEIISIEAAGFEILGGLVEKYIDASNLHLNYKGSLQSKRANKIFDLLAKEYRQEEGEELYSRYLKIVSYVSGMTDSFALNLFQRMKGIKI